MRCSVAVLITVLSLCVVAPHALTQAQTMQDDGHTFLRDPNNTFVFLKFDHLGTGMRRSESEPSTRIWFRFVNNTNVSIQLQAYGTPQGSLKGEVGVMDSVVLDPPMLTVTSDSDPHTQARQKGGARVIQDARWISGRGLRRGDRRSGRFCSLQRAYFSHRKQG
jgi:hypothetical protein